MNNGRVNVGPSREPQFGKGHGQRGTSCVRAGAWRFTLMAAAMATAAGAQAQEPAPAPEPRAWNLERSLGLRLTATDNARLTLLDRQKDVFGQAVGNLRLFGQTGAVRGVIDYSLTGTAFAKQSDLNDTSHQLRAAGTGELVPGFAFIDATASVGRVSASLQEGQTGDQTRPGASGPQVRTFSLAPNVRGTIGNLANYDGRVTWTDTRAGGASGFNTQDRRAALRLAGGGTNLGWYGEASLQKTEGALAVENEVRLADVGLTTEPMRGLKLAAFAGKEWNDFAGRGLETAGTWGARVAWAPTETTSVTANYRNRLLGSEHLVALSHRTTTMVWTLSDSRSTNTSSNKGLASTTLYDVYSQQFASQEADAVRRDALVRDYLRTVGLDPSTPVVGGFLGAGVSLDRSQTAAVAWVGPRSTAALRYVQTRSELLRTRAVAVNDDFSFASVIRQRGVVFDMSHRLTPIASVSLVGEYRRAQGDNSPFGDFKSATLSWLGRVNPHSDLNAGLRYSVSNGAARAYKEWSAFAGYRISF